METEDDLDELRTVNDDQLGDRVEPLFREWLSLGPFYGGSITDICQHDEIMDRLSVYGDAVRSIEVAFGDDHVMIVVNPAVPEAVQEARSLLTVIRRGEALNEARLRATYREHMDPIWTELDLGQRIALLQDHGGPVSAALQGKTPECLPIGAMADLCDY